jgi:hypothetical protein
VPVIARAGIAQLKIGGALGKDSPTKPERPGGFDARRGLIRAGNRSEGGYADLASASRCAANRLLTVTPGRRQCGFA